MRRILQRSISRTDRRQIELLWLQEQCPGRCPGRAAPKLNTRRSRQDQRRAVSSEENPVCKIPWLLCCAAFDRETTQDRGSPPASPVRMAESQWDHSESSDAWRALCPEKRLRRGAEGPHRRPNRQQRARAISDSPYASMRTFPQVRGLARRFGARGRNIRGHTG